MKIGVKGLSVLFLAAIYCFAIDAANKTVAYAELQNHTAVSEQTIITDFSANLFCHTKPTENLVNSFNNLTVPNFNQLFTGYWAILKATQQLNESKFSRYSIYARNILIHYRKSDIIFPFHYFW